MLREQWPRKSIMSLGGIWETRALIGWDDFSEADMPGPDRCAPLCSIEENFCIYRYMRRSLVWRKNMPADNLHSVSKEGIDIRKRGGGGESRSYAVYFFVLFPQGCGGRTDFRGMASMKRKYGAFSLVKMLGKAQLLEGLCFHRMRPYRGGKRALCRRAAMPIKKRATDRIALF